MDLVLDALTMAWFRKHPEPGAIFHSDRGSQYAAKAMRKSIKHYRLRPSMSGKGSCFDNGAMESFWKTLKTERMYLQKIYETREIAKADIVAYMWLTLKCLPLSAIAFLARVLFTKAI